MLDETAAISKQRAAVFDATGHDIYDRIHTFGRTLQRTMLGIILGVGWGVRSMR